MIKHTHGEDIRRQEDIKGQRIGIRERRKALNVDEVTLKGDETVL